MKLLKSKSSGGFLLLPLYLLLLLVIAISSLRANFANKLKNLSEFFFTKFKTHHNTFSDEVLFKHKLVTIKVNWYLLLIWIKLLVGFLYWYTSFLKLLSKLIHEGVCVVHWFLELKASCYCESIQQFQITKVFHFGDFLLSFTQCTTSFRPPWWLCS